MHLVAHRPGHKEYMYDFGVYCLVLVMSKPFDLARKTLSQGDERIRKTCKDKKRKGTEDNCGRSPRMMGVDNRARPFTNEKRERIFARLQEKEDCGARRMRKMSGTRKRI